MQRVYQLPEDSAGLKDISSKCALVQVIKLREAVLRIDLKKSSDERVQTSMTVKMMRK
jgi:hypothetical protein